MAAKLPRSPLAPASFPVLPVIDGVTFAAVSAVVKYQVLLDGMLAKCLPGTAIAGTFTRSATRSAPVLDCQAKLRLEMRSADIRSLNTLDQSADCTDSAEPSKPVREFEPGQQNELMLLRACFKYEPLFPDAFLGSALSTDASGEASLIVTTAFVQEPL